MRTTALASLACLTLGTTASAQSTYSEMLRDQGLSSTISTLQAIDAPSPSDTFALGGAQFLAAIEHTLQLRYSTAFNEEMLRGINLPFLRLPQTLTNPNATPFESGIVATLFEGAVADLGPAITSLDTITDNDAVAVKINTQDIWFDINANGNRDAGEGVFEVVSRHLNITDTSTAITIQFDTADAAWLSAYAHMLSGVSETILATDPTPAITRVIAASDAIKAFNVERPRSYVTGDDGYFLDLISMFIYVIEGTPDAPRLAAAHDHFLSMIADNRTFWARVATETDNKMEWIPNPTQQSVLPIPFDPNIGPMWQGVLADAEAVLNGDLLIPHWRFGDDAGINVEVFMNNPPDINIVSMIQGEGVLPYVEKGLLVNRQRLWQFEQLVGGAAPLYMVVLN